MFSLHLGWWAELTVNDVILFAGPEMGSSGPGAYMQVVLTFYSRTGKETLEEEIKYKNSISREISNLRGVVIRDLV